MSLHVVPFVRPLAKLREAEHLTLRAVRLYPNADLAVKWTLAVRWLRSHRPSKWVLDGASPGWSYRDPERR